MTSKYRRTLSLEDLLVNGSDDDELEQLISQSGASQLNKMNENGKSASHYHNSHPPYTPSSNAMKNGMKVGPIIAPGVDSPENDDFFLHGPQVPILNLDTSDMTQEMDTNNTMNSTFASSETNNLPRSKSVRFQEPDDHQDTTNDNDRLKGVRVQVDQVTDRMKDNVARLLQREANLGSLQDLSDQLQYSSDIYRQSSEHHLRRKMWWRQQRSRLVLGGVFIIGIVLLIIPIITKLLQ